MIAAIAAGVELFLRADVWLAAVATLGAVAAYWGLAWSARRIRYQRIR